MYYIQIWKLCYIARHHLPLQSIASGLRRQFISGIIDRTVIDITQLGCPPLADIILPGISRTFVCHKYRHVCAMRTAYSLAQWLNFYIPSLQYAMCPTQPTHLSKKDYSQLTDLASACIDRQVIKFCTLEDELVEWRDNCVQSKCFCTLPNTNAIDFDTLWDELSIKTSLVPNKCLYVWII